MESLNKAPADNTQGSTPNDQYREVIEHFARSQFSREQKDELLISLSETTHNLGIIALVLEQVASDDIKRGRIIKIIEGIEKNEDLDKLKNLKEKIGEIQAKTFEKDLKKLTDDIYYCTTQEFERFRAIIVDENLKKRFENSVKGLVKA